MSRSLVVVSAAVIMIALAVSLTSASSVRSEPIGASGVQEQLVSDAQADPIGPLMPNVPCLVAPPPPSGVNSIQSFTTTQWQFETPIPTARSNFALAAKPGDHVMFAFGGVVSVSIALTSTERYDACSGRWDEMAPLPEPRGYASAVEIDGKYYVVGGVDQIISNTYNVHKSTYVYDPAVDSWKKLADLPQALGGVALATANGKLYAFGGFDSRGVGAGEVDTTYEFDPLKNIWRQRASMISGTRSLAGAASWHGKIFVVGGRATNPDEYTGMLNTMIVYDPTTNKWSPGVSMPVAAFAFAMAVAPDDGLYALGGRGQEGPLFLRYDPVAARWDYLSTVYNDDYRSGAGVAYARGRLFIVGGDDQSSYIYHPITTQNVESLRLFDDFCLSSLTADRDRAGLGDHIRYTIELHSGIEVLDQASVIDPLPSGITFVGFTNNPIGAGYNSLLNRVEWYGALNNFTSPISFTFEAVVNQDVRSAQRLTNTASFGSGLSWSVERSTVTRIDVPDLSASVKLADQSALASDGRITYTLRVVDDASQPDSITLTDQLPANVAYVENSLRTSSGEAALQDNLLTWRGQFPTIMTSTYTNASDDYQWGDSHGGGSVQGVQYNWIEISETGRPFAWYPPADNDRCYPVPIPFSFSFYGQVFTRTAVQIDGTMYFYHDPNGGYEVMGPDNQPIPMGTLASDRYIGVYWDDIYLPPGRMYYQVVGNSPNRRVVIEYHHVSVKAPNNVLGQPGDFELVLFEGSSAVLMQYKDVDFGNAATSYGAGATIGLQDSFERGLQYSYNTPALSNEMSVLFLPPQQTYTYSTRSAEIHYAVTTSLDALPIMNTATISDSTDAVLQRSVLVWLPSHWVYLPILLR